ncbi:hypothetical protein CHGG_07416 [Chaetomium globosum CBS 148.51]|uniref:Uncharacterized protein n=1 Tax=Chaetomium globosum (strain ATCC 6205 / CBS 148.51 / DSM 1962 / NBRC 6347 / NRRL 1970) TaxID=306901 RepID=Q2GX88_CHAGB|nr:uncharacterized protein CHGG_07416 [Chaetomium globosum CBS 148.51]EAQ86163.1 hypothetical protein CHGG_07416 [Chaetomium globosum CBS 148.51]
MWRINLRSQPSRPAPPYDPAVEAWLDSLPPPTAKPSSKELQQWRLTDYHGLGWSVFVTCNVLRTASLLVALSVIGIIASVTAGRQGPLGAFERLVPVLVVCPVVALWNTAELVVAGLRRDGGIPPKLHIGVDGVLFLGVATATGTLLVDVICGITDFGAIFDTAGEEIASICLLIVMMVIHSFLLFFFICHYVESVRNRSTTPATTGPGVVPQYAENSGPWPSAEYTASNTGPHATPEALKALPITSTLELRDSYQKPHYKTQVIDVPSQPGPATGLPPAAVLEGTALAQAMSGLWDVEAKSPHQTRWSGSDEKTVSGNAVQSVGGYWM